MSVPPKEVLPLKNMLFRLFMYLKDFAFDLTDLTDYKRKHLEHRDKTPFL